MIIHLGIIRNFIMLEIAGKILPIIAKISNKNPAIHIFQKVSKKFQSQFQNYFFGNESIFVTPRFLLIFSKKYFRFSILDIFFVHF